MHRARHVLNPRTESFALAALLGLGVALAVFQDVADDQNEADGRGVGLEDPQGLRTAGDPAEPVGPKWVKESLTEASALGGITVLAGLTAVTAGGLVIAGKRREAC